MRPPAFLRAAGAELAAAAYFVAASIAMTWPLARHLSDAVSDTGDPLLVTWFLHWDWIATITNPLGLFHAPIFYPLRYTLAFSEHVYGIALPMFPLFALGVPPIAVYNVAMIVAFAFSGYGAYVLARLVTGSTGAAIAAGTFFAFVPYRFDHLAHMHHIWAGWLPLLVAALIHYFRAPSAKRAALFGAAFVMNGITNMHWFVFGSFAVVVSAAVILIVTDRVRDRRAWGPLLAALLLGGLLLLPFLLPYRAASELYGVRRHLSEVEFYSANWSDWLVAPPRSAAYGGFDIVKTQRGERALFPGLLALVVGASAVFLLRGSDFADRLRAAPPTREALDARAVRRLRILDVAIAAGLIVVYFTLVTHVKWSIGSMRILRASSSAVPVTIVLLLLLVRFGLRYPEIAGGREGRSLRTTLAESRFPLAIWVAFGWVAMGVLGSFGTNAFLHRFLYQTLEVFRSIRVPARWAMIAYVGLAVLVAAGLVPLLRGRSRTGRAIISALATVAFLLELRAAPIAWRFVDPEPPPVYRWLATAPVRGGVIELPMHDAAREYFHVLRATAHGRPIVNGISGFEPPLHHELAVATMQDPIPAAFGKKLREIGCSLLVVHNERYDATPQLRRWLAAELDAKRIAFVGRFDHELGGDYVFEIVRGRPLLQTVRDRDGAAPPPEESLRVFLESNGRTYFGRTSGFLGYPAPGEEVRGPLAVNGWALSPFGIREVTVRLQTRRVTVAAKRQAWATLAAAYPWYREPAPWFRAELPRRPSGVRIDTDVEVEIADKRGGRTRLEQVAFRWLPATRIAPKRWKRAELESLLARMGYDPNATSKAILEGRATIQALAGAKVDLLGALPAEEFVRLAYRTLLDREPDPPGFDFFVSKLVRGGSRHEIVEWMVHSGEFQGKYLR